MKEIAAKTVLTDFLDRLNAASTSILLLDYDGTLAPFHTRRDRAYPYPGVIQILESIIQCSKTRVVLVSGRPVRELQILLHPLNGLEMWGAHGLEHLLSDGTYQQTPTDPETAAILVQAQEWLITTGMASLAEIKPGGIALHWRGQPHAEIASIQARTQEGWTELAKHPGIKLLNFEGGLELRIAHPNKGDVVTAILEHSDSNAPIAFLGDDFTDEDAFDVLGDRGLSVLVRPEYRETGATVWLKPPHELIDFLKQWLRKVSA